MLAMRKQQTLDEIARSAPTRARNYLNFENIGHLAIASKIPLWITNIQYFDDQN